MAVAHFTLQKWDKQGDGKGNGGNDNYQRIAKQSTCCANSARG